MRRAAARTGRSRRPDGRPAAGRRPARRRPGRRASCRAAPRTRWPTSSAGAGIDSPRQRRALVTANLARVSAATGRPTSGPRLPPAGAAGVRASTPATTSSCCASRMPRSSEVGAMVSVDEWERWKPLLRDGAVIATLHLGNPEPYGSFVAAEGLHAVVPVEEIRPKALFDFLLARRASGRGVTRGAALQGPAGADGRARRRRHGRAGGRPEPRRRRGIRRCSSGDRQPPHRPGHAWRSSRAGRSSWPPAGASGRSASTSRLADRGGAQRRPPRRRGRAHRGDGSTHGGGDQPSRPSSGSPPSSRSGTSGTPMADGDGRRGRRRARPGGHAPAHPLLGRHDGGAGAARPRRARAPSST